MILGLVHTHELYGIQQLVSAAKVALEAAGLVLQVKGEISGFLKMLGEVYKVFGLDYSLALSTRPEGYLGEIELWDQAETALQESLNDSGALVLYSLLLPVPGSTLHALRISGEGGVLWQMQGSV